MSTQATARLQKELKELMKNPVDGFKVELVAELPDHDTEVWKVKWNVTGTILSSAGDDGKVRLWKAGNRAENEEGFKCMGIVCNDRQSNDTMEIL